MDATTYAGNGTGARAITNTAGFKPDFVWLKDRTSAYSHQTNDSVRGATNGCLYTDLTNSVDANFPLTSFNSNGFTLGNTASLIAQSFVSQNGTGDNYVAWQWQAGQGTNTSNTSGSITSTVSVNASAGFSIVTYTGTGSNATVGHSLGIAPSMVIVKSRSDASTYWCVYQSAMWATSGTDYTLLLPLTNGAASRPTLFNSTQPSSTVFSIGTNGGVNNSGSTYVAYCWSQIAGFSAFGSYTGNGSYDGSFVYTGFKPKYVMIKISSTTGSWYVLDTSRSPYNEALVSLNPNSSAAESTDTNFLDILSNGFKLRTNGGAVNGSGATLIYMAFAENPFKNALAR
jgi:hypothetical protein